MVRRILVEKKKGFDVEAKELLEDINNNLNLNKLSDIRVINRYDVEGIDDYTFQKAKSTVFSELAIDILYEENISYEKIDRFFAYEYLPGQYDQRADSAVQCIKLINPNSNPVIKFARLILLEGKITDSEFAIIKNYCINPVDSQIASMDKPESLIDEMPKPENVEIILNFNSMNEKEIMEFRENMGFAMSKEDIFFVQEYFTKSEDRAPTITELKVIDTYWSDHCRHTTFLTELENIEIQDGKYGKLIKESFEEYINIREKTYGNEVNKKPVTLMDMACIGAKYLKQKGLVDDIDESDEINACSIKTKALIDGNEEDWIVMFKNETHNHPTEIEPFGGAATCLGGAIRDPLSGRVYVYQAMRVTGSADPRTPVSETIPGKLPQSKITRSAASGYSSYGNQIGIATGQVEEIYHPGYVAKRMEVGAVIGAAPAENIRREKPLPGDAIILVGGRTGRDGCGGATGSSKGHNEESIATCGAEVQKGNPPVERNIQRLFREKRTTSLIKKCNDFGAGGISVAIGELADSIDVNLDLVLKKYEGLDGTELAISESQERMAVVVEKKHVDQFIKYAENENLEATEVALVTDTGRFRMFWRHKIILDLSRDFLDTNGVKQKAKVLVKSEPENNKKEILKNEDLLKVLGDLNCCLQKGLSERFDSTIGRGTVLMPYGGKYQLTPSLGMVGKLPVITGETTTATVMTYGFDPMVSSESPYHGALYAVIDSVTKQVGLGSDYRKVRLSFQEYFERLGTNWESWGKPFSSLLGALKAQIELGIPAIGGKDSMSGTFMEINVPPSLISFAVSVMDSNNVITSELKPIESRLVYIKNEKDSNGILDLTQYKKNMEIVSELSKNGEILAANTISEGGVFASLCKMAAGNKVGLSAYNLDDENLISPDYGGLILQFKKDSKIEENLEGANYIIIGNTNDSRQIMITKDDMGTDLKILFDIDSIIDKMTAPLESIFPLRTREFKTTEDLSKVEKVNYFSRGISSPIIKVRKPKIVIPVFPGTNCEIDSKAAFEKAGGEVEIQIIRNLTEAQLIESIDELEEKIRRSQIIMLPGGFSGGDEPDGSGKFITAIFRNPKITDAVNSFLQNRDGLMLGICNGFQALIKLGLVPYGEIKDMDEESPTLTYNKIGRHYSGLVNTRISSVKSPWLANVSVGEQHTLPVSHGEGRFIVSNQMFEDLASRGQIATQYVDYKGNPSMDIKYNPNYSDFAVEGITSPDGRIFGKMGHSERIGSNLYKNVQGDYDQKIFKSGIEYFKI